MSSDQDTFVNGIEITDTSPATSTSASLFTIGGISILNTTNATTTSASFLTLGGSYVQGNSIIGGTVQLLGTTLSTNTSTGILQLAGGLSVQGNAYGNFGNFNFLQAGTSASIPNLLSSNISANSLSVSTLNPTNITCQNLNVTNSLTSANSIFTNITCVNLVATSTANIGGFNFQYYTSSLTGSWIDIPVGSGFASGIGNGGPGVNPWIAYAGNSGYWFTNAAAGDICYRNVTGSLLFGNSTGPYAMQILNNTVNISGTLTTANLYSNNANIASLNSVIATLTNVNLTNLTAGSAIFRSTTASNNTGSGAVVINGGLGLGGDLNIGGNTSINGNLTVFGSTVTVNSTNVSIVDNIIQLNVNSTGIADSGIKLGRYQIANNVGSGDIVNDTIAFSGTVITGSTTTLLNLSSGASSSTDFYIGYWIKIVSGTNINQVRQITAYNGTTKTATLATTLTTTPINGDTLNLYGNVYAVNFFNQGTSTFQLAFTNSTTTSVVNIVTQANLIIGNLISNLVTTNNLQATNATITNLNLPALSLTNLTVSNLFATNSSLTNLITTNQSIGNQYVTNQSIGNQYVTNETVTNLITTTSTLGNTVNSNITIGTLNVIGTSNLSGLVQSTNQTGTNATISNIVSNFITGTNLIYTNGTITNFIGTNSTIANILGTNTTITNVLGTNATFATLNLTNSIVTNLTATNSIITNISSGTVNNINLLSTNNTLTNILSTNATFGTLNLTNLLNTNLSSTNALITSITNANLLSTNGTFINGIFTNISSTNSRITNETVGIINVTGTGITTTNLNFTGNLYQNGILYTPSSTQWTTTAGNLSYTSGNVIVGGIISSSNLITTNGSISNAIGTNLNYTNTTFTNILGSNFTSTNILGTNSTISNSVGVNLNYTNISTTNLAVPNLVITNLSLGNLVTNSVTAKNFLMTGITNASNILYIDCQYSQTFPGQLIFKNSYGTGDFRIYGDGGDVQWQGGGGRACQMGAWHEIRLTGGRISSANIPFINGSNSTYNTIIQNSNDSIALTIQANTTQNADLTQWTNNIGTVLSRIDRLGNLQITSTADIVNINDGSISITGGSITTSGGVSIGKSVYIGSSTIATNNSSGALIVNGGAGFNGDLYANNMYVYQGTTATLIKPFLTEYNYVSIQATSGVTSTVGSLKTSLTTGTLVGGTYKIDIDYNIYPNTSANQNYEVGVYLNTNSATGFNVGTTTSNLIHDNVNRPAQTSFNIPFSSSIVRTFGNSIQTIGLYYRTLSKGESIIIGNTSILLYRIQ